MEPFLIVVIALWIYPVITLFLMLYLKQRPKARKVVLIISACIAGIGFMGILSGISTINENIDWFLVSAVYLFISLIIWQVIFQPNLWIRILGFMLMLATFGFGYFTGSVGLLGIAVTMGDYEHHGKIMIDTNLYYTESTLGNADSEIRGKRIAVFKNYEAAPFLERKVFEKSYTDIVQFSRPVKVKYDEAESTLYLSIPAERKKKYRLKGWADTIQLDLRH